MKFTKIQLRGLNVVDLPLTNVSPFDPYILKDAQGLGPPDINLFLERTMDLDGYYKGRQTRYREPTLTIGLNPNYIENRTVSDLRQALYGLLSPTFSDKIELGIFDESTERMVTQGYIKNMEGPFFTESPEIKLTLLCETPYFEAPSIMHVETPAGLTLSFNNEGNAETGLFFEIRFTDAVSMFSIVDTRGNSMVLNNDFKNQDLLLIGTNPGNRFITVTDIFETRTIIHALSMDSKWVLLYGGPNTLTFNTNKFVWNDLYYKPKYWGI